MHSRADQVQAHRFLSERLVSALVLAEADAPEQPLRRTSSGLLIGALVAGLAVAAVSIYGLLVPSDSQSWRGDDALVLEKETGNRYLLIDDVLRPVLNETSVRLLLGADYKVDSVSRDALRDVVHGSPVGIAGAPDALPQPGDEQAADAWVVCSGSDGLSVRLGRGNDVGPGVRPLRDSVGVLVRAGTEIYLAWRDRRFRLAEAWVAGALGLDARTAVPVRESWLNTLAAGPDLGSVQVTQRGATGPTLDGRKARRGQLFDVRTPGAADRLYLLGDDGLRQVSLVEAALVLGDPQTRAAYPDATPTELPLTAAALAEAPAAAPSGVADRWPSRPPVTGQVTPCVEVSGHVGGRPAGARLVEGASGTTQPVVDTPEITRDSRVADRIGAVPGSGSLVLATPDGKALGLSYYLITEAGVKYPVASAATAEALGYTPANAYGVPPSLLALLPTGPVLRSIASAH